MCSLTTIMSPSYTVYIPTLHTNTPHPIFLSLQHVVPPLYIFLGVLLNPYNLTYPLHQPFIPTLDVEPLPSSPTSRTPCIVLKKAYLPFYFKTPTLVYLLFRTCGTKTLVNIVHPAIGPIQISWYPLNNLRRNLMRNIVILLQIHYALLKGK